MTDMADYDIGEALQAIEHELMASMVRNMQKHRLDEIGEKKQWEMWQALQLKALEEYKRSNRKKFKDQFSRIDKEVENIILEARLAGNMEQEIKILKAIQNGYKPHIIPPKVREWFDSIKGKSLKEKIDIVLKRNRQVQTDGEFFRLNTKKLDALIKATQNDLGRAEQAMLRMADDQYRRIIFNAQVYANTGAGTYEKAMDMATKDFLSRGINCIEYKNGARHMISEYADMAIKTANKRAYLTGEGEKRQEWGISTVIMNKRGNPCPKCLPFVGKILIDDVWSGGSPADGDYPLMSDAIAAGLYHPRCMDSHTTYFDELDTPGASYTRRELNQIKESYRAEQKTQYARRQADRFERLAEFSMDGENQRRYVNKKIKWKRMYEEYENSKVKYEHENTIINANIIESREYRNRIDALKENIKSKRNIWNRAREMLYHRNGTNYEDLAFVDSKTGKSFINKSYDKERQAKPNKRMQKLLKQSEPYTVIAIHNHPGSNVPSINDMRTAFSRKYKYGLVVCHNGAIYKYAVSEKYNDVMAVSAIARLEEKGYNADIAKMFLDAGIILEVL